MRKFIIKLLIFLSPVLVFMELPRFTKYIMDADLEAKINTFLPTNNNVDIIIAGDSRAERQLIPNIFDNKTGKKTVNVAKDVGDVISLLYADDKYHFVDSNKVFVVCVSSLITNDGSYKNWFMSQASITEIGLLRSILLFGTDYPENWYHRMGLIWGDLVNDKRGQTLSVKDIRFATEGYYPVNNYLDIEKLLEIDLSPQSTEHLWYRKPNNNGIRKKVFVESIKEFSKTKSKIILIQSPMAPTWRAMVKDGFMHKMELDFCDLLDEIDSQYDNILVIDFYKQQPTIFTDELFYNATHLNNNGAQIFTKAVIDSIETLGLF